MNNSLSTDPWEQGYAAYYKNGENPYNLGTTAYAMWNEGYYDAEEDDYEEPICQGS